jgi:hypothetical protein
MGQSAHPGLRAAWTSALSAVGLVLTAGFLTGCSSSVASAPTVLQGLISTTVVHTDGTTSVGRDGMRLRRGDVVRTGVGGRAELVTSGRLVYVGSQAAVQVLDGAHQQLLHGATVVNALHGPQLRLDVATLDVTTPAGSAVRAERSVVVRIGTLAGAAGVTSSSGRRLTVPALHQAMVGGDALPDSTTPLRLTDDDGEALTVPDLVRDDETLNGVAAGIDTTGGGTARAVDAAWHGPLAPTPSGAGRSERLLPALIAAAGPSRGELGRYDTAVADRRAGGSWGVVARLVGVRSAGVVAALAAFERHQPAGHVTTVAQVLASARAATPGNPGSQPGNNGGGHHPGGNGGSPTPSPSPSPSSSGPVDDVLGTVDDTVGKVLSVLPTPTPTHTSGPAPLVSLPPLPLGP